MIGLRFAFLFLLSPFFKTLKIANIIMAIKNIPIIANIEFPLNKYKNYFDLKNTIKNG
ncbi:hypothetical protein J647_1468 [Acinetobacter baumannii 846928]|nr:hypothetical protein ACIN5111_1257 [Acinetobacter baumannii OIFC111]EXA62460.1 hypothetical protein J521_0739 [Acinetobacter baumannii 1035119]EXB40590.1 hypothetical protein J544_2809 [Acinetobacter baumannii 1461963]EXH39226.1 hypothetical protein J651_3542 [Acinetobacter baumannii 1293320]EXI38998.1 hypothetical protein J647_1468 [Acinetobacter baumannii 846928]